MPTVDQYIIQRSPTGVSDWVNVGTVSGVTTTFTDTGLTAETTYYYRVFAQNDEGTSAASNVASATTSDGSVMFSDTFTDTDGTLITDHDPDENPNGNPWEYRTNTGATTHEFEIHGNAMSLPTADWSYTNWMMASIDTGFYNASQVTFTATMRTHVMNTQGSNMVWFAAPDQARNGDGYACFLSNGDSLRVVRYISGSGLMLSNTSFAFSDDTDYTIRIEINGDDISVYVDDVFQATVNDGTFRGGYYGYQIWYSAQAYSEAKVLDNMTVAATL